MLLSACVRLLARQAGKLDGDMRYCANQVRMRLGVLDGLRGIAVLLVLWYHVWEITWLPAPLSHWLEFVPETGFIGVHLFFFLSGFVIAYPFVRAQWAAAAKPTWGHFVWRRFVKIAPSYVLSIVVAFALGYAQRVTPGGVRFSDVVWHLLFVHTWFPHAYGALNGVLWTLAVEVEFYCIFPLVWWCFRRAPWLTGVAMIAVAMVWRNALNDCCYHTLFAQWEENLPGYLDIFACGMLTAYAYVRYGALLSSARWKRGACTVGAIAGFAALAWLLRDLYAFRLHDQWAGVWQIDSRALFGVAFGAIALGSLASAPWWRAILANPLLVFFATISYNLYLYHQLIARELLWHHIPPFATADPHADAHWQVLSTIVAFAVSIAAAALVTYGFEKPLLRLRAPSSARPLPEPVGN